MTPFAGKNQLIDVVFQTLRNHVESMSAEQQLDFTEKVLSLSPSPAADTPGSSSDMAPSQPAVRTARRKAKSARNTNRRGKKAVNAFMIFRAYLAPILGKLPQKNRSPMLSQMWRAEQRKGQFNLLGAAFSSIRDGCTDPPTLEKFLETAVETVTVIPADKYLELTGWTVVDVDGEGIVRSINTPDAQVVAAYPLYTALSTQDIVQYCFDRGLINNMPPCIAPPIRPETLSFASLPQNHDLLNFSNGNSEFSKAERSQNSFNFNKPISPNMYNPSFDSVTQDQQLAHESTPAVSHWDPAIHPPILGFDPNIVQDDFDPFSYNIDEFLNL